MKKVKTLKGYVIAETNEKERIEENKCNFEIFSNEEWQYGDGCRYPDWECESIQECTDFINSK